MVGTELDGSATATPAIIRVRHGLSAGEHLLKFRCNGKNRASQGYFFGLDLIELMRVD